MKTFSGIPNASNLLLIVDDNTADRELFTDLICQAQPNPPFQIIEARSCDNALAILETCKPACCLVDYKLPVDNGLDFLKTLRRMNDREDVPVVITATEGDEELAVEIMRSGAQDYLTKQNLTSQNLHRSITNAIHTCSLQSKLRHLAHHDCLTGLLNRGLFMDRLQTAIDHCDRYGHSCSLLYIDVDNFKQINDQYGHEVGDGLLKAVGERIKQNCRVTDSAARLGGDEFAILLSHINEIDTKIAAEKILKKVCEPVLLKSHSFQVSLSIGIAHYPDTAANSGELISQADEAMYRAKRTGKARYFQFTDEQKKQWDRRNRLQSLLPKALENGDFRLAFQPIIDVNSESFSSLEVLVRWFPVEENVSANEIIEMVERLRLFDVYHLWLIDAAFKQLHQWQKVHPDIHLCLNIPAHQCDSDLVVDHLTKSMSVYKICPQQIEVEISEKTLTRHPTVSSNLLYLLQQAGVNIAIDDFGSGSSSMSYLTSLPISTLKIDQRFFTGLKKDICNRRVIDAVTALGHSLDLQVVAKGIESHEQYHMARNIGCDLIQGFYVGKPQLALNDWNEFVGQFPVLSDFTPDSSLHIQKSSMGL